MTNKLPTPEERIVLSSCCKRVCFIEWGSHWCGLCHMQEKAPQEYISVSQILARLKELRKEVIASQGYRCGPGCDTKCCESKDWEISPLCKWFLEKIDRLDLELRRTE